MNFNTRLIKLVTLHGLDFFLFPTFVFLSAPLIITTFDVQTQGKFSVFLALFAIGHFINFGISNATIQTLNLRQGLIVRDINFSVVLMFSLISLLLSLVLSLTAYHFYRNTLRAENAGLNDITFMFIGVYLFLEQLDFLAGALLKTKNLIAENMNIDVLSKFSFFVFASLVVFVTQNLMYFFSLSILFVAARIIWRCQYLKSELSFNFEPIRRVDIHYLGAFADKCWSLQKLALVGLTFSIGERLILPREFSVEELAALFLASQIASLIHAIPAGAMSFCFPLFARGLADFSIKILWLVSTTISLLIGLALLVLGEWVILNWFGEIGEKIYQLTAILSISVLVMSTCVVPYYYLINSRFLHRFSNICVLLSGSYMLFILLNELSFVENFVYAKVSYQLIYSAVILGLFFYEKNYSS